MDFLRRRALITIGLRTEQGTSDDSCPLHLHKVGGQHGHYCRAVTDNSFTPALGGFCADADEPVCKIEVVNNIESA